MIIIWVEEGNDRTSNITRVQLPHANMVIDPRLICDLKREGYKFSFSISGTTLTITRIDGLGGCYAFTLRAYLPTEEEIPDFTSTIYTYWGLEGERAPKDTTELIFHPSVTTIEEDAFLACKSLVRVIMPDTVTRIEFGAFHGCVSLKFIRLPRNLVFIGDCAFLRCKSIKAVFLPPTVLTHINDRVFYHCTSLRYFYVPPEIIDQMGMGEEVFKGCDGLLAAFNFNGEEHGYNDNEVHELLRQRYANLPFHQACFSTLVTPQEIEACFQEYGIDRATEVDDQQMTALHILCLNPHVTGDVIRAYLQLAPEAADQEDSEGMTPFQYLCRSDIAFLEDRSFSSLMIWWYHHCMPPQAETSKKRKRG